MIFGPELAQKVLRREKTETRRPQRWKPGSDGDLRLVPCRYKAGRTYAVQPGRTKRGIGRIRILSVDSAPLVMITEEEVHREGFADRKAFFDYWRKLYQPDWIAMTQQAVWVIRFELVERTCWRCGRELIRVRARGPSFICPARRAFWRHPRGGCRPLEAT